eukprot:262-Rhodomonas_salina.3
MHSQTLRTRLHAGLAPVQQRRVRQDKTTLSRIICKPFIGLAQFQNNHLLLHTLPTQPAPSTLNAERATSVRLLAARSEAAVCARKRHSHSACPWAAASSACRLPLLFSALASTPPSVSQRTHLTCPPLAAPAARDRHPFLPPPALPPPPSAPSDSRRSPPLPPSAPPHTRPCSPLSPSPQLPPAISHTRPCRSLPLSGEAGFQTCSRCECPLPQSAAPSRIRRLRTRLPGDWADLCSCRQL